jgi:branched-chain amino acid aminotransferase
MLVWWNGKIVEENEVRLSPMDHGFLVGDGVFETLLARRGQAYAVKRHWLRLDQSCQKMGLVTPDETVFRTGLDAVLQASGLQDARLRVTLTSGIGPAGSDRGPTGQQTLTMTATALKPWPATERLAWSPWPRFSRGALAGIKSTSYADNVRALATAKTEGCGECLFTNEHDDLCEGTGSNLFLLTHGRLQTPPLTSGCLAGVTRALVIQLAQQHGLTVEENNLPADLLRHGHADEVFLTSTTRDIHPVSQVGSTAFPAPGPITQQLQTAFLDWQASEIDP